MIAHLKIRYRCVKYKDLSIHELYEAMRLRQEVFVLEQNCPYVDADGLDPLSYHVLGNSDSGKLVSYTRICPPGVSYKDYVSIGRVAVQEQARGTGEGYKLMEATLGFCSNLFPNIPNKISAQTYLLHFYQNIGYVAVGEGYLEDDIPHIAMIRS